MCVCVHTCVCVSMICVHTYVHTDVHINTIHYNVYSCQDYGNNRLPLHMRPCWALCVCTCQYCTYVTGTQCGCYTSKKSVCYCLENLVQVFKRATMPLLDPWCPLSLHVGVVCRVCVDLQTCWWHQHSRMCGLFQVIVKMFP